jgi:DNA-binding beta-propeller fold protein YncE
MRLTRFARAVLLLAAAGCAGDVTGTSSSALTTTFAAGDVFVSLKTGKVQWWRGGALLATLPTAAGGFAEGMKLDSSNRLYATHWCADGTCLQGNTIERYESTGQLLGAWGSGYDCNPTSLDFDTNGNAFVGQADCWGRVLQLTATGQRVVEPHLVAVENRGSMWIDLAPDNCTLFYTSSGPNVLRYNVCARAQLPNFNAGPMPDTEAAFAVQVLSTGGLVVANTSVITRLDELGEVVQTYDVAGERNSWYGLALTPDEHAFWATIFGSPRVYELDLATGALLATIDTGMGEDSFLVKGVAVSPGGPPVTMTDWRMTGGGSSFTDAGMRITHGLELHCDAGALPNSLEINWHGAAQGGSFHLTDLTFARCTDDPALAPAPPAAPFDTYEGAGTGRVNGEDGGSAEWIFTDAGEPGVADRIVRLIIRDANGDVVLDIAQPGKNLTKGNHQAHK